MLQDLLSLCYWMVVPIVTFTDIAIMKACRMRQTYGDKLIFWGRAGKSRLLNCMI